MIVTAFLITAMMSMTGPHALKQHPSEPLMVSR